MPPSRLILVSSTRCLSPPCVVGDKSSKHPTCGAPRCRASRLLRRLPYDGDVAPGDTASRRAGENAESPETAPTLWRLGIVDEEVRAKTCARKNSLESSAFLISLERSEEWGWEGGRRNQGQRPADGVRPHCAFTRCGASARRRGNGSRGALSSRPPRRRGYTRCAAARRRRPSRRCSIGRRRRTTVPCRTSRR